MNGLRQVFLAQSRELEARLAAQRGLCQGFGEDARQKAALAARARVGPLWPWCAERIAEGFALGLEAELVLSAVEAGELVLVGWRDPDWEPFGSLVFARVETGQAVLVPVFILEPLTRRGPTQADDDARADAFYAWERAGGWTSRWPGASKASAAWRGAKRRIREGSARAKPRKRSRFNKSVDIG